MTGNKHEVMLIGPLKPVVTKGLEAGCEVHKLAEARDQDAFITAHSNVRAIACSDTACKIPGSLMARFPALEIVASFGVGYDHMDVKWAAAHNVVLTNTPNVLTEEVADTALGLLLVTVREFYPAEKWLRDGRWARDGEYPLTASLRDRTVGIAGFGRIGKAIARRIEAFGLPVSYFARAPQPGVNNRYYGDLIAMARDVDTLIAAIPGGPATDRLIDAAVFDALGPHGIFINMARGSVVDEPALIAALRTKRILRAGLDVFLNEPAIDPAFLTLDNVTLFPHLGSASVATRNKMGALVVDNLAAFAAGRPPKTPVPETPFTGW